MPDSLPVDTFLFGLDSHNLLTSIMQFLWTKLSNPFWVFQRTWGNWVLNEAKWPGFWICLTLQWGTYSWWVILRSFLPQARLKKNANKRSYSKHLKYLTQLQKKRRGNWHFNLLALWLNKKSLYLAGVMWTSLASVDFISLHALYLRFYPWRKILSG